MNNLKTMFRKEIIFLGTGAPDAKKYSHSSFYIKEGDKGLLVDADGGNSILTNLDIAKIPLEKVRHAFITHKHMDHLFGIFWLLRFVGVKINKGEADKLTIYSSQKVADLIQEMSLIFLKEKITRLFHDKIIFHIISDGEIIPINDWNIQCIDVKSQKEEQFGFCLKTQDGIKITFFGDEPYKKELAKYSANTDYLIHDAFCLERDRNIFNPQEIGHSTVKQAAENAKEIGAKNLILFHTEDRATFGNRKELYRKEATEYFSGKIFVPDDLESISI